MEETDVSAPPGSTGSKIRGQKSGSEFYEFERFFTRVIMAVASFLSILAMGALLGIGLWQTGRAVGLYVGFSHFEGPFGSREAAALEISIRGLEFLFLAPLSYLLILSVTRYLERAIEGPVSEKVRAELLIIKAFGVALLIAVLAASLVGKVLSDQGIDYRTALTGSLIIVVLAAYLFLLERLALTLRTPERK